MIPFAVSTADATLLAAAIAAVASLLKLVFDAFSARGASMRVAHRSILQPHLGPLGEEIHEVVAGVVLVHRRFQEARSPDTPIESSKSAASSLKKRRLQVKYSLPGLDEALRVITRTPDWILNYKGHTSGDELVAELQELSNQLDLVIGRSYRHGRPPSWNERRKIERSAKSVRAAWNRRFDGESKTSSE